MFHVGINSYCTMWAGTVTPVSRSATEDDPAATGPSCGPQCALCLHLHLCIYAGCPSLAPLYTAHCLPHCCVGSGLHGRFGTTLFPGTMLPHSYYLTTYLISFFSTS